jgi:hypothetical protein
VDRAVHQLSAQPALELRLEGGSDMRYARHLVPFAFALGLAGAASAKAQPPEEEAPEPYEHPAAQPYQQQQQPYQPYQPQQPYQGQEQYPQQPPPYVEGQPQCCQEVPAPVQRHHVERKWEHAFSPYQFAITIGGGGADFVKEQQAKRVLPGAAWNARLTIGTRSYIAFELAYVGSMNKLIGPLHSEPQVLANGFESDARINFTRSRVQPYGFGGIGYMHWTLHNRDLDPVAAAAFNDSDNQLLVPVGAGLTGYIGHHFVLDGRFTYRFLFDQDLFVNTRETRTDQWSVHVNAGWAF